MHIIPYLNTAADIAYMNGAIDPAHVTGVRLETVKVPGGIALVQASDTPDRVVLVNRQALALFQRIGLKPPDSGEFDIVELDKVLDAANITTTERLTCKAHLRDCGLLSMDHRIDVRASANDSAQLPIQIRDLVKKAGVDLGANGTVTLANLDACMDKSGLPTTSRFTLKTALLQSGRVIG